MTEHQKAFHRRSATGLLVVSVFVFCCMIIASVHATKQKDAGGMAAVSAIASLVFSLIWICSWVDGRVSIRSVNIERKSEPNTYRLAMVAFLIIVLAFLVSLIWSSYVLLRPDA